MTLGGHRSLSWCCTVMIRLVATQKTLESEAPPYGVPFGAPRGCFGAWTGPSMETRRSWEQSTKSFLLAEGMFIAMISRMLVNVLWKRTGFFKGLKTDIPMCCILDTCGSLDIIFVSFNFLPVWPHGQRHSACTQENQIHCVNCRMYAQHNSDNTLEYQCWAWQSVYDF